MAPSIVDQRILSTGKTTSFHPFIGLVRSSTSFTLSLENNPASVEQSPRASPKEARRPTIQGRRHRSKMEESFFHFLG